MPRVLIIAHHFPPAGTGGVGRALGWVRHLPALGWEVTVLAATPAPNWPLDTTLTSQIPGNVAVHRVASADPRPERFRGLGRRELSFFWYRPALAMARSLVRSTAFDVILATTPPPAAHRLAYQLSRESGLPWAADFRDPWTVRAPGVWRSWRRRVYATSATACMAVNSTLARHLEGALKRKVVTVFNGFEPDEMPCDVPRGSRRAIFLGSLPKLETLSTLFAALAAADGEFLHIGPPHQGSLRKLALAHGLKRVEQAGYLSRAEALRLAATGSVYITALEPDLALTLPTKIFDYIGLGGPILHVGPKGATSEFVKEHGLGGAVEGRDPSEVSSLLQRLWSESKPCPPEIQTRFERKRQAEQTASLLSETVRARRL